MGANAVSTKSDLALRQQSELESRETIVADGLRTFVDVGRALMEIRDKRLYKEHFQTFESYCRKRWSFTKTYANQQIAAACAVDGLATIAVKPDRESQVRPLLKLHESDRAKVWEMAVETAPDGKVTARHVARVVREQLSTTDEDRTSGPVGPREAWISEIESRKQQQPESQDWNVERFASECDELEAGDVIETIVESCMRRLDQSKLAQLRLTLRMLEKRILKDG